MSAPANRKTTPRHILAAQVAELRDKGMFGTEIARELGISRSYAYALISDPTGELDRKRKEGYRGTCVDCGASTSDWSGSNGGPAERCRECAKVHWRETYGIWDRERVLAAIHAWADEHGGVPPAASDWNPPSAIRLGHPEKAEKFYADGAWPHTNTVQQYFGSWNAALEAAGFEPRAPGQYGRDGEDPAYSEAIAEMYREGMSAKAIAEELGVSKRTVFYHLERAGQPRRTPADAVRLHWQQRLAA